ncbi:hypothetical protein C8R44DRAFT_754674 [Mycena epipterygia]|nr:hypothetical protein C8R44DRAFT_754674 [Mycena epipterygia]
MTVDMRRSLKSQGHEAPPVSNSTKLTFITTTTTTTVPRATWKSHTSSPVHPAWFLGASLVFCNCTWSSGFQHSLGVNCQVYAVASILECIWLRAFPNFTDTLLSFNQLKILSLNPKFDPWPKIAAVEPKLDVVDNFSHWLCLCIDKKINDPMLHTYFGRGGGQEIGSSLVTSNWYYEMGVKLLENKSYVEDMPDHVLLYNLRNIPALRDVVPTAVGELKMLLEELEMGIKISVTYPAVFKDEWTTEEAGNSFLRYNKSFDEDALVPTAVIPWEISELQLRYLIVIRPGINKLVRMQCSEVPAVQQAEFLWVSQGKVYDGDKLGNLLESFTGDKLGVYFDHSIFNENTEGLKIHDARMGCSLQASHAHYGINESRHMSSDQLLKFRTTSLELHQVMGLGNAGKRPLISSHLQPGVVAASSISVDECSMLIVATLRDSEARIHSMFCEEVSKLQDEISKLWYKVSKSQDQILVSMRWFK